MSARAHPLQRTVVHAEQLWWIIPSLLDIYVRPYHIAPIFLVFCFHQFRYRKGYSYKVHGTIVIVVVVYALEEVRARCSSVSSSGGKWVLHSSSQMAPISWLMTLTKKYSLHPPPATAFPATNTVASFLRLFSSHRRFIVAIRLSNFSLTPPFFFTRVHVFTWSAFKVGYRVQRIMIIAETWIKVNTWRNYGMGKNRIFLHNMLVFILQIRVKWITVIIKYKVKWC